MRRLVLDCAAVTGAVVWMTQLWPSLLGAARVVSTGHHP